MNSIRYFKTLVLGAGLSFLAMPISASAQDSPTDFPTHSIRLIVPFTPGGDHRQCSESSFRSLRGRARPAGSRGE